VRKEAQGKIEKAEKERKGKHGVVKRTKNENKK
jgi:hypothetical protein